MTSTTQHTVGWIINQTFYGINSLNNGTLPGYSADLVHNNLIVENIMMNDDRNGSEYGCAILISGTMPTLNDTDPIFLYVAGKYICIRICIAIA